GRQAVARPAAPGDSGRQQAARPPEHPGTSPRTLTPPSRTPARPATPPSPPANAPITVAPPPPVSAPIPIAAPTVSRAPAAVDARFDPIDSTAGAPAPIDQTPVPMFNASAYAPEPSAAESEPRVLQLVAEPPTVPGLGPQRPPTQPPPAFEHRPPTQPPPAFE